MGDTFVNVKIDGDPWNGAPPTAGQRVRTMAMQLPSFVGKGDATTPINFHIKTLPCAGEGGVCRLEIVESLVAIAGTDSAKRLLVQLAQGVRLLRSKEFLPGQQIPIDLDLSALFADFFKAQGTEQPLRPKGYGAKVAPNKASKPAKASSKPSDKKPGSKKKPA
jgi:hypothetical protein